MPSLCVHPFARLEPPSKAGLKWSLFLAFLFPATAMPLMHGIFDLIKDVEWPGHPLHCLDAVLYAENTPKSMNAVGSCSDPAFRF